MKLAEMLSVGGAEKSYAGRMGYFNALVRRRVFEMVESLGIIMPGEPVTEPNKRQNLLLLAPGAHGGNSFRKIDTELHALAPGAVLTKPLTIEEDAVIDGITFSGASGDVPLVTVGTGTTVFRTVFRGCTFEKPTDDISAHVSITTGAKVILVGCVFRGSGSSATPVVDHPIGLATDVQIAFCSNKTNPGGAPNTLGDPADVTLTGNI